MHRYLVFYCFVLPFYNNIILFFQLNGELYWPINEQDDVDIGNFTISLRKIVNHTSYIQRTLSVQHNKRKSERIIVHMQFLVWPSK